MVEVAAAALVGQLFVGELNFAFAFLSLLPLSGGVIAFNTDAQLYEDFHASSSRNMSLVSVLFVGSGYALVTVICSLAIVLLDTWTRKNAIRTEDSIPKRIQLSDLKQVFSVSMWFITLAATLYYTAYICLSYNGKIYFDRKFGLDARTANFANSLLYIVPAVLGPFIGLPIDMIGFTFPGACLGYCVLVPAAQFSRWEAAVLSCI